MIDIDPQGNASTGLGVPRASRTVTTYDVLMGEAKLEDAIEEAMLKGVAGLEKLKGSTGLVVDVSGSMNYKLARKGENHPARGGKMIDARVVDAKMKIDDRAVDVTATANEIGAEPKPACRSCMPCWR